MPSLRSRRPPPRNPAGNPMPCPRDEGPFERARLKRLRRKVLKQARRRENEGLCSARIDPRPFKVSFISSFFAAGQFCDRMNLFLLHRGIPGPRIGILRLCSGQALGHPGMVQNQAVNNLVWCNRGSLKSNRSRVNLIAAAAPQQTWGMEQSSTRDHENATADPSPAAQDDRVRGRRTLFSGQVLRLHLARKRAKFRSG